MGVIDERDMIPVGSWAHAEPARRCSYAHCPNLTTFVFNSPSWVDRPKGTLLTACRRHRTYLWPTYGMGAYDSVPDRESP